MRTVALSLASCRRSTWPLIVPDPIRVAGKEVRAEFPAHVLPDSLCDMLVHFVIHVARMLAPVPIAAALGIGGCNRIAGRAVDPAVA